MTAFEPIVAIATESDGFDRAVYLRLLELSLSSSVRVYETEMVLGNRTRVRQQANLFLGRAAPRDRPRGARRARGAHAAPGALELRPLRTTDPCMAHRARGTIDDRRLMLRRPSSHRASA